MYKKGGEVNGKHLWKDENLTREEASE